MVGWCILFMLVIIVLAWRERKKYAQKMAEVESRLAQVEELLLEVCALIEEERLEDEELPPLPLEPVENERANENLGEESDQFKPSKLAVTATNQTEKSELKQPDLSSPPPPQPRLPDNQGNTQIKSIKAGTAKLPAWNQKIIEMWHKGLSIQEIARQIEKGQGEVQLIVDLYCDQRPQS